MNEIIAKIQRLVHTLETLSVDSRFGMILLIGLIGFGLLNAIFGYRLLRFWVMLGGFIAGAAGVFFAMKVILPESTMFTQVVGMCCGGIVLAVITFFIYKAGIFLVGAVIGWSISLFYLIRPTTSAAFFGCVLIGVIMGALAVKFNRVVIITGTSILGGAFAGAGLAEILKLNQLPYGIGIGIIAAALGMLIQFLINRPPYEESEEEKMQEAREQEAERMRRAVFDEQESRRRSYEKRKQNRVNKEPEMRRSSQRAVSEENQRMLQEEQMRMRQEAQMRRRREMAEDTEPTVILTQARRNERRQPRERQVYNYQAHEELSCEPVSRKRRPAQSVDFMDD